MQAITLALIFSVTGLLRYPLSAQSDPPVSEPMQLPEFVIRGAESITVPGGAKKFPKTTRRLTNAELDSLNSLEKKAPPLLPFYDLPQLAIQRSGFNGFVRGEAGMFITPLLDVGYSAQYKGYDIYARGGFEVSDGHTDEAQYSKLGLDLRAGYLAPEKFWLFGGSQTDSYLQFNHSSYKLYADTSVPERSATFFDVGLDVDGDYNSFAYQAGVGFSSVGLARDSDASGSSLRGDLGLVKTYDALNIGAAAAVDLQSVRGDGLQFIQLEGLVRHTSIDITLEGRGGVQIASNSLDESQSGVIVQADAEFRLNPNLTLRGNARTGLKNHSFADLVRRNPYLADSAHVVFAKETIGAGALLTYHPAPHLSVSAGVDLAIVQDLPVMAAADAGTFMTVPLDATIIDISLEALWQISAIDEIYGRAVISSATLDEGSTEVPYIAPIQTSLGYKRYWTEKIFSNVEAELVGQRSADVENTLTLDSYVNLSASATYMATKRFHVFLRIENLADSRIVIWQGYVERGIFGSVGATLHF